MLQKEINTAQNIKDKNTRKKVLKSLNKTVKSLKLFRLENNGCFVFASPKNVWIIKPEFKNTINDYHCGKKFRTDYLKDPGEPEIVLDLSTEKAVVYRMHAMHKEVIEVITSGIPSSHGKGGMSQQRFNRKYREAIKAFIRRVKEHLKELDLNPKRVEGDIQILGIYNSE